MFEYDAVIERVVDGDTVRVDVDMGFYAHSKNVRLRFLRVFASELRDGGGGLAARDELMRLLPVGARVRIATKKIDRYGRWLAEVWRFEGTSLVNVNDEMQRYLKGGENGLD
jgi:micrococcal nuclease